MENYLPFPLSRAKIQKIGWGKEEHDSHKMTTAAPATLAACAKLVAVAKFLVVSAYTIKQQSTSIRNRDSNRNNNSSERKRENSIYNKHKVNKIDHNDVTAAEAVRVTNTVTKTIEIILKQQQQPCLDSYIPKTSQTRS